MKLELLRAEDMGADGGHLLHRPSGGAPSCRRMCRSLTVRPRQRALRWMPWECYMLDDVTLTTSARCAPAARSGRMDAGGDTEARGVAMRWLKDFMSRERVTVLPTTAPAALRRQVQRVCHEYASALGVSLPPLVVELEEVGGSLSRRGRVERVEGERGVLYRLTLPLRNGTVVEAELRRALLRVLMAKGALVVAPLDDARCGGNESRERDAGETDGSGERVRKAAVAVPVWLRWRERGRATPLVMASPVGGDELPLLKEALARRGVELLAAVPYPARDERARPLDGLAGTALRRPLELTMCLRRMAGAASGTGAYVAVPIPPGCSEEGFMDVAQALTGVRLAAGVMAAAGRIYLRLPAGIEVLAPYLDGEWLERAVAAWVRGVLVGGGRHGVEAATRARVRVDSGREAEVDVVATAGGRLVVAECSIGAWTLLRRAGRRRQLWLERRLPGDVVLTVCVLGGDEEMERLREAYGWPAWRPARGLEALERIIWESRDGGR